MAAHYRRIADFVAKSFDRSLPDDGRQSAKDRPHVPGGSAMTDTALDARWSLPGLPLSSREELLDARTRDLCPEFAGNIENFIGTVKVPVGLAGPLRVNGLNAQGSYYVPLATTEAALVASYSRGAQIITEAGGCSAVVLSEGVSRAPAFVFASVTEAAAFSVWASNSFEAFRRAAQETTRYGGLADLRVAVEGNHVHLVFDFVTGDAAGQNMATIAADAICRYIEQQSPIRYHRWFVEGNLSGDKKATIGSLVGVRGRKVCAEIELPCDLIERRLHTTSEALTEYWRLSAVAGVMSGSIGVQGHYANGLAAMFIACGQDAACVAEAAVGVTRFEPRPRGGLYAAVTLPNLIVGTVGGGTKLPSQRACLDIMGLSGAGHARAFAEVAAAVALAGELSITGAMAAGEFTRAHRNLARGVVGGGVVQPGAGQ